MPKELPERQCIALLYMKHGPALVEDIAQVIRDDKPAARSVLTCLRARGYVESTTFPGMVHGMNRMHKSTHAQYSLTEAGRVAADAISQGREPQEPKPVPRQRTSALHAAVEVALLQFIDLVEKAGGVRYDPRHGGMHYLEAERGLDRVDTAKAYLEACRALDRKPKVS